MIFYVYLGYSKAAVYSPVGFCLHWRIRLGSQRSLPTHLLHPSELSLMISGTTGGSAAEQVPAAFAVR